MGKSTDELQAIVERFNRMAACDSYLICDGCGKCYADDSASDSESCYDCVQFKQRMEWANVADLTKDASKTVGDLAARLIETEATLALRTNHGNELRDVLDKFDEAATKCYEPLGDYRPTFCECLGHLVEDAPKWKATLQRVRELVLNKLNRDLRYAESSNNPYCSITFDIAEARELAKLLAD